MDWYRAKLESDKFQLSKHRIFVADVEVRVLAEWGCRRNISHPSILNLHKIDGRPDFKPANKMFHQASINDSTILSPRVTVLA
jgi:hypothetical protein